MLFSLRLAPPAINACTVSRNDVVSFSSCITTAGSISSADSSRLAFFGRRWLNMTRWLARDTSRTPAPESASWLASCSATSCKSTLRSLMRLMLTLVATRFFCCDRICVTCGLNVFHCASIFSSVVRAAPVDAGTASSPSVKPFSVASNEALPAASFLKAAVLPRTDCWAVSGRRCDSTFSSPARVS